MSRTPLVRVLLLLALGASRPLAQSAPAESPLTLARTTLMQVYLDRCPDPADACLARAVTLARTAVARAPGDAEAHRWLAAALGTQAMRAPLFTAIRAGREGAAAARRAVQLDSSNAGAHAVLARYVEDAARLRPPLRVVLGALPGLGEIRTASLRRAEEGYRTAIRLEPGVVAWRHAFGCFLARSDRLREAEVQADSAWQLATDHPMDNWYRHDVRHCIVVARRS